MNFANAPEARSGTGKSVAVMAALPQELRGCFGLQTETHLAGRVFGECTVGAHRVVSALSGMGKVSAALTATLLIDHFDAGWLIFLGVAGGLAPTVQRHDVVVATDLLHHDLDASPLLPRFQVPGLGTARMATDASLSERLYQAASHHLHTSSAGNSTRHPKVRTVHRGLIVSGDQFIRNPDVRSELRKTCPDALAVEMEGAAVAQVCASFNIPFAVLRTISDDANDEAAGDFQAFVEEVAGPYSAGILEHFLSRL